MAASVEDIFRKATESFQAGGLNDVARLPKRRLCEPSKDCPKRVLRFFASIIISKSPRRFSIAGCRYSAKLKVACCGCSKTIQPLRAICEKKQWRAVATRSALSLRNACRRLTTWHGIGSQAWFSIPYNAHTTASDALWVGLPVLTCLGDTFAGRAAASLLNAMHLPELIMTNPGDCERMAVDLATNPEKLTAIKRKLAENRLTMPLFNTKRYARHIEAAYTAMYQHHQAGLRSDHIIVPD